MRSSAASSAANGCWNSLPCAESSTTDSRALPRSLSALGAICNDSTASKIGSGFSTMPSPPPKGRSSTVRCLSRVNPRRSCTPISMSPASRARRTIPCSSGPRKKSGKMVRISNFIANLRAASSGAPLRLLFFFAQRRIQLEQPLGQRHLNHFLVNTCPNHILLCKRDEQFVSVLAAHYQQRRLTCAKLHPYNFTDLNT